MNDTLPDGDILHDLEHRDAEHWEALKRRRALHLFHQAARRVPAYQDHLRRGGIDPSKVTSFEAFQDVPPVSKRNYLKAYPLKDMCWDGSLARPLIFGATSGTTGEPFYFPRSAALGWQSSWIHEVFLRHGGAARPVPTLVLICFGLGVWIAGLITYQGFETAARRGRLPVSILTPGINKVEILNALRRLSPQFEQTILVGYPPFLKDILDAAAPRPTARCTLVRYAIGDRGGVTTYRDMAGKLAQAGTAMASLCGPDWPKTAMAALPFVHVQERTDASTTLYGLQVYPAPIRDALIQPSVAHRVTGQFAMAMRFDGDQNQYLEINLEARLESPMDAAIEGSIRAEIVACLARSSSEYRELLRTIGERAWPRLVFWPPGDPKYFAPASKRRWVAN